MQYRFEFNFFLNIDSNFLKNFYSNFIILKEFSISIYFLLYYVCGLVVERLTAVATVAGSNPTSDTCPAADPAVV